MKSRRTKQVGSGWWQLVPLLAILVTTASCVEYTMLIKLQPDGSGELIETSLFKGELAQMFQAMGGDMSGEEGEDPAEGKRREAAERAGQLGEGVSLVSWAELPEEEGMGERVVYRFDDVTKLGLTPGPSGSDEGGMSGSGESIRFRFEPGADGSRVLTAVFEAPEPEGGDAEPGADEAMGDEEAAGEEMAEAMGEGMMEMMKPFLAGMKLRVLLDVGGEVLDTTAPAVNGSEVTLMALDFDQLLGAEGAWDKLTALGSEQDIMVVGKALEGVPGVQVPVAPEVTVRFRGE